MTQANREVAISETLKWEGGYSNNPSDPGGPTNWGITIADAQKYWKKDATAADVKAMPKSVAIDIYRSKYWVTPYYDCDKLDSGVDLAVFDFGVNSGPARAKKYLDLSVGGPAEQTIDKLCDYRMSFLKSLKTWPVFGTGWTNRVTGIRAKSKTLSKQAPTATGKATGALIATGGTGVALTQQGHSTGFIIACVAGALVAGVLAWLIIEFIKNRKNNV